MRITLATSKAIKYACLKFHYAKCVPVAPLGYNVYNDKDEWCGVILYSWGANMHIGSPYGLAQGQVLELVRCALNGKQEATSMAVAMTLKQVKKDCPMCRLIVSYADSNQGHLGTIYQATNWIYEGKLGGDASDSSIVIKGKKMHKKSVFSLYKTDSLEWLRKHVDPNAHMEIGLGKQKYLFPLDKKMRKQILPLSKPYPKNDEDWQKIDRSQF